MLSVTPWFDLPDIVNRVPLHETLRMSVNGRSRAETSVKRFLRTLERISLAVEKPLARLVRDPRFNPLYHTGTITVFLLLIIIAYGPQLIAQISGMQLTSPGMRVW